jgi:hypothetical protein
MSGREAESNDRGKAYRRPGRAEHKAVHLFIAPLQQGHRTQDGHRYGQLYYESFTHDLSRCG